MYRAAWQLKQSVLNLKIFKDIFINLSFWVLYLISIECLHSQIHLYHRDIYIHSPIIFSKLYSLTFLTDSCVFYRARRHKTNWNFFIGIKESRSVFFLQLNDKRIPLAWLYYKYTFPRHFRIKLNFCPCVKGNNKNSFALFCPFIFVSVLPVFIKNYTDILREQ